MILPIEIPDSLHQDTISLVIRFSEALARKLYKAEVKYGYSDGWMHPEWVENGECSGHLMQHLVKGDPRDVAAYCAFLWHHDSSTTPDADDLHAMFTQLLANTDVPLGPRRLLSAE